MGTAYDGQDSYFCNGFRSTDLYTVINNKMHSFEKKSRLHIALCALSLLAACASDPIGEEAPQPVGEPSRETAATGRLRVKFKQGEVPERIIETRSGLQTGSEPLDRAIAALGVTRMQRVFPPAGRFEARTRRAGLDRWYDVWFDSLRSVTRATLDLSMRSGVSGPSGPSRLRCLPRREPPRCRSTIRGLRSNGTIPTTDRCPMPSPEPTSICFGRGR